MNKYTIKLDTIKKIRALCYATLGVVLCLNAYKHDKYILLVCTAIFVICMRCLFNVCVYSYFLCCLNIQMNRSILVS